MKLSEKKALKWADSPKDPHMRKIRHKALRNMRCKDGSFLIHKMYIEELEVPPGEYYSVGRNASHEFYLGKADDGRYLHISFGEKDYDEKTEDIIFGISYHEIDPSNPGYIGHL